MRPPDDLRALLAREAAWVHRLAVGLLGDEATGADVAQDAVALAMAKRPAFGGSAGRARGWLRAVVDRLARGARRAARDRRGREGRAGVGAGHAAATDETAARLELHHALVAAVRALPEPYRATVVMRYLEERSTAEIADRLGVPVATVRQRLKRGLDMLRERLHSAADDWRSALAGLVAPAGFADTGWMMGVTMGVKKAVAAGVAALGVLGAICWTVLDGAVHEVAAEPGAGSEVAGSAREAAVRGSAEEEPAALRRAATDAAGLTVEVVDARDRPIAGAHVFAWSGEEAHVGASTDAGGRAALRLGWARGVLLVTSHGLRPQVFEGVELRGQRRVVLGAGRELRGRVRIDQQPPGESVQLQLEVGPRPGVAVPESLRLWYGGRHRAPLAAVAETGADGSFVFGGLPERWSGVLRFERRLTLDPRGALFDRQQEDTYRIRVDEADQDIVVDLMALPYRRCRLVYADDGAPVSPASCHVVLEMEGGFHTPVMGLTVGHDGRFTLRASPSSRSDLPRFRDPELQPRILGATLYLRYSRARRDVTLGAAELSGAREVRIEVPRVDVAWRAFRVVDARGRGIAGAVLQGEELSAPTDAQGVGRVLQVDGVPAEMLLGAPGFAFRRVAVPPAGDLEFALEQGAGLEVQARSFDGTLPAGLRLAVSYDESPFLHGADGPTALHHALMPRGDGPIGGTDGGTRMSYRSFALDAEGRAALYDLRPGAPLRVELRDVTGNTVVGRDIDGVGATEHRRVLLEVMERGKVIRVRTTDRAGRPLGGVHVSVGYRRDFGRSYSHASGETDGDGRVALPPLYAAWADFRVTTMKKGFVAVDTNLDGPLLDLQLDPAVDLDVAIVDPGGAPVRARRAWIEGATAEWTVQTPSTFRLTGVHAREVEVSVQVGCHVLRQRVDARRGAARIEVPAVGSARFSAVARPGDEATTRVLLRTGADGDALAFPTLRRADGDRLVGEAPALLPGRYRVQWTADGAVVAEFEVHAGQRAEVEIPR